MGLAYVPVARVGGLASGAMVPVEVGGRQLLLAHVDGRYYAFVRECPHEGTDLRTGNLSGSKVSCVNHGYCFDLTTGECVVPSGGPRLTTLPVEVRGEDVCIRLEW